MENFYSFYSKTHEKERKNYELLLSKNWTEKFKKYKDQGERLSEVFYGFFIYLFIYLFNVGKGRYTIPVYRKKNSFPYKNKVLIKANGAIKSIMNKNVETNK